MIWYNYDWFTYWSIIEILKWSTITTGSSTTSSTTTTITTSTTTTTNTTSTTTTTISTSNSTSTTISTSNSTNATNTIDTSPSSSTTTIFTTDITMIVMNKNITSMRIGAKCSTMSITTTRVRNGQTDRRNNMSETMIPNITIMINKELDRNNRNEFTSMNRRRREKRNIVIWIEQKITRKPRRVKEIDWWNRRCLCNGWKIWKDAIDSTRQIGWLSMSKRWLEKIKDDIC